MNRSIGVVVLAIVPLMVVLMDQVFAQQAPRTVSSSRVPHPALAISEA